MTNISNMFLVQCWGLETSFVFFPKNFEDSQLQKLIPRKAKF